MSTLKTLSRLTFPLALSFASVATDAQVPFKNNDRDLSHSSSGLTAAPDDIQIILQKMGNPENFRFYEHPAVRHDTGPHSEMYGRAVPDISPDFYLDESVTRDTTVRTESTPDFQVVRLGDEGGILTSF